jgi:tRNA(His) guanylyltransferase
MTDKTSLGDRMKGYESDRDFRFMPYIPVMARLDGKAFHSFTKGMDRPFDSSFSELMVMTTKRLVDFANARIGYTQSDEISLVWLQETTDSEIFMAGRSFKMISLLAAEATRYFNRFLPTYFANMINANPLFDCRVWSIPTKTEACNALVWREQDATRNSVQMAGQAVFSHNQLMGKSCNEIQDMLHEKGINWNDYPDCFKRGTYVQRHHVIRKFTAKEINILPEKHEARTNPGLKVRRSEIRVLKMPVFTSVANREEVVFHGAGPEKAPG